MFSPIHAHRLMRDRIGLFKLAWKSREHVSKIVICGGALERAKSMLKKKKKGSQARESNHTRCMHVLPPVASGKVI